MTALPSPDIMYRAAAARDAAFDGVFVVAVRTTGIYCRPTCPARTPLRANVEHFRDCRAAAAAGYRPCKRCRPLDSPEAHPAWVTGLLARIERAPAERISDRDLAAMGIAPEKARRYFRHHFAMTFHAWQRSRRLGMALESINRGGDLTRVAFDAGFESNSGFREAFRQLFGHPPGMARGTSHLSATLLATPLGPMVAAATPDAVCLLDFGDRPALQTQATALTRWFSAPIVPGTNAPLEQLRVELQEYFDGRRTRFDVPLAIAGTPFQQSVWQRLLAIPFGETTTYSAIARDLGRAGAQRAVGKANGDNRHAVIIPCHRVTNSRGQLHGYGGGLWRKRFLLEHELGVRGDPRRGA